MKAPHSASQSISQNYFFSKTPRILMKFYRTFLCLKDKKVTLPGESFILGKKPEMFLKVGFFGGC